MASLVRHVLKDFLQLSGKYSSSVFHSRLFLPACHLYTDAAGGLDSYYKARERVQLQFSNMADKFKTKMEEFANEDSKNMIFTEDLKNMIHLIDKESPKDLNLVIRMMKKFNAQNKDLRFGSYIFGPVVMRMFSYLNEPLAAFELFKDPVMEGFFDQLISYQLLLDNLLKNGHYKEVIEAFEIIVNKQIRDVKYPRTTVVLAMAALYRLNDEESLKYAMNLWSDLLKVGHTPLRKAVTFAAGLALKQNSPHYALEILGTCRQQNYVTVRNLKITALADLGRGEEALSLLRSLLLVDSPEPTKRTVCESAVNATRACIESSGNKELLHEFEQVEKRLKEQGYIEGSVEDQLWKDIDSLRQSNHPDRRFIAASFSRDRRFGDSYQRDGDRFSREGDRYSSGGDRFSQGGDRFSRGGDRFSREDGYSRERQFGSGLRPGLEELQ